MLASVCWSIFGKLRVAVFVMCGTLNVIMAALVVYYLGVEWKKYDGLQKFVVTAHGGVEFLSGLSMILLLPISFRPWIDLGCVLISLILQLVSNFLMTKRSSEFPCIGFGSAQRCRDFTRNFIIGSWALSGLFLGYLICLGLVICFAPSHSLTEDSRRLTSNLYFAGKKGRDSSEKHASQNTVASFFPHERDNTNRQGSSHSKLPSITHVSPLESSTFLGYQPSNSVGGMGYGFSAEGTNLAVPTTYNRTQFQAPPTTYSGFARPTPPVSRALGLSKALSRNSRIASTMSSYSVDSSAPERSNSKISRMNSKKSLKGWFGGGKSRDSNALGGVNGGRPNGQPSMYSESEFLDAYGGVDGDDENELEIIGEEGESDLVRSPMAFSTVKHPPSIYSAYPRGSPKIMRYG